MKSVFKTLSRQNPGWSTLVTFNNAVIKYKYPKGTIDKFFDELVDKKDYIPSLRDAVLEHTYTLGSK